MQFLTKQLYVRMNEQSPVRLVRYVEFKNEEKTLRRRENSDDTRKP